MAPKKGSGKGKAAPKVYDYSGLEKGTTLKIESDGSLYIGEVVAVSTSKNRAKAPVKVSYKGYEGYDEWVGGDRLRSKALKVEAVEKPPRDVPHMIYFPLAGRGEMIRLIAAAGGLKITESTDMPEGDTKAMYMSPSGVPVLKHGTFKMSQSLAIENYIASIAPKYRRFSNREKAIDQMWGGIKEEVLFNCAKGLFTTRKTDPEQAKQDITALFDKWFSLFEEQIPSEGFIQGKKFPTAADLAVLNMTTGYMPFGAAKKHAGYDFAKFPKVLALAERTAKVKEVAEYLASASSFTDANPMNM